MGPTSTLEGWTRFEFGTPERTYECFEKGAGPGVVLIPEVPGITPEVLGLAEHLVESGFTVVIPSLFGTPGHASSLAYSLGTIVRLCISAEMRAFARNAHRPVTDYLRALASDLAARTPGRGVGVIGMCFTGGFALATAVEPAVLAPVMAEPAVPFPLGGARQVDPGVSPEELTALQSRTEEGLCVLGLRFSEDATSPGARFDTLRRSLGDAFEVIELDSARGNPDGYSRGAHSVLTREVRTDPPNSAFAARERTVQFLRERL
ncbi:dienelactone hydrolase family protein [Microbacterium sp. ASV49]|uniref:Dienelactone hydrolase family protein n=1 Tax=Microbacterium candidum TaxID=3041922 RepID=A0ABT7MTX1_9MICO|nr:dienelactone hydrolase family protein [Microbacterium sp. ASV49]MDL9977895.1 dienelactone hydrolase family protein [Microbacterium sp. ASV49]